MVSAPTFLPSNPQRIRISNKPIQSIPKWPRTHLSIPYSSSFCWWFRNPVNSPEVGSIVAHTVDASFRNPGEKSHQLRDRLLPYLPWFTVRVYPQPSKTVVGNGISEATHEDALIFSGHGTTGTGFFCPKNSLTETSLEWEITSMNEVRMVKLCVCIWFMFDLVIFCGLSIIYILLCIYLYIFVYIHIFVIYMYVYIYILNWCLMIFITTRFPASYVSYILEFDGKFGPWT